MHPVSSTAGVAFVTCTEFPDGADDDRLVAAPLASAGVDLTFAIWDDATVDWSIFDLVVLRSTWDYPPRHDRFLTWAASVPRLANPLPAVTWSSDKHYLADVVAAGVPTITTLFLEPEHGKGDVDQAIAEVAEHPAGFVVKPAVGAGSIDAGRYRADDECELAASHAIRLLGEGRSVLIQPYLDAIDVAGETAMCFIGGRYSHALTKAPMLRGPAEQIDGLFGDERVVPTEATAEQRAIAEQALAASPGGTQGLLYARVDLIDGPCGDPVVLECELVEPSLWLADAPGAADRFAAAIVAWLA